MALTKNDVEYRTHGSADDPAAELRTADLQESAR